MCGQITTVNDRNCAQGRKNREIDFSGDGRDCGDWIKEVKNIEKIFFLGVGGIANLGAMAVVYGICSEGSAKIKLYNVGYPML